MTAKDSADREPADPIRVLIVEDQEFEAELTSRQLRASGIPHVMHRVDTESDMCTALRHFRPTVILSDFTLPQFDGLTALEIARQQAPEIPFLFVSGTIGEERAIEALRRGAVDYVLKTNLARLGPAVRRALDEAAARLVRHRQETQIARLTGVLRMVSGINSVVVRIHDRAELLREACRLAVTVGGYSTAIIALRNHKLHLMEPVAFSGADQETALRLCRLIAQRATREAKAGKLKVPAAFVFSEAEYLAKPAGQPEIRNAHAKVSVADRPIVALPLVVDKTVMGVLAVCSQDPGAVGEEEMRMLREVAANLSFALQYLRKDTKVRWLSYFDVLTGLAKRALFCERLGKTLREAGKQGSRYAVAVLDIENLSAINDSYGRHAGDSLLQLVADRLKGHFRDTEMLAHFSGGTFALAQAVEGATDACLEKLNALVDSLFAEPFLLDQQDVPVAARSGAATFPEDGREPDALVQKAEATLRSAKLAGVRRGHYSAEHHSAALARVALERRLRVALERQQFELHYQPKVEVRTRRIVGVEALIRWNDLDAGLVSPASFLPILESSGLIVEVGDWVIQRAATDCRGWHRQGLPPVRVAVNISPVQLRQRDFVSRFVRHTQPWVTADCGLDIEITEGALEEESNAEIEKLKLLRAGGVSVAIDDFGTGYSSLSRLADLPVDTLKIDRSFINRITDDARGNKLVSIIVSIARALEMQVVAEGVEAPEQLEALRQMGCSQSQGYLHCRPVTRDRLAELLSVGNGRYLLPRENSTDTISAAAGSDSP